MLKKCLLNGLGIISLVVFFAGCLSPAPVASSSNAPQTIDPAPLPAFISVTPNQPAAQNQPATQVQPAVITIINETGYTVWYVHVSPADDPEWGYDLLASNQVLENGESFIYELPYPLSEVSLYDMRLTDSDLYRYVKWDFNVAQSPTITFTQEDFVGQ